MLKKVGHEPSRGQIVKSQEISVLIITLAGLVQAMRIISVDPIVLRHLFFANSIFRFIIRDN